MCSSLRLRRLQSSFGPYFARLKRRAGSFNFVRSWRTVPCRAAGKTHSMSERCLAIQGMIKLVLIGDVHYNWEPALDRAALKFLQPDAAIFVGDFGEEAENLVREIADVDVPKAVILGNHDAWDALYYGGPKHRVERQIQSLGEQNVGFGDRKFVAADGTQFSVVGARPFSDGNASGWRFTQNMFNFEGSQESAEKISTKILEQPHNQPIVVVGHNGPTGLGSKRFDPCGRDFKKAEGDHGDSDLEAALLMTSKEGRNPALVTFGHMHEALQKLRYSTRDLPAERRNMVHINAETGTVYLNCAVVPRHKVVDTERRAHFVVVNIKNGVVNSAENVWIADANDPKIVDREQLVKSEEDSDGKLTRSYYKAFKKTWSKETRFQLLLNQCSAA